MLAITIHLELATGLSDFGIEGAARREIVVVAESYRDVCLFQQRQDHLLWAPCVPVGLTADLRVLGHNIQLGCWPQQRIRARHATGPRRWP